jgi:hypothetical protein
MVTTIADLRPGDIGFGPIKGGAGLLVGAGQLMLGEGFRVGPLSIRHVFVVTGVDNSGPRAVEAMPSGARELDLDFRRWTPEHAYVRLPEDYPGQASDAAAIARAMIGTPYSFASYAALAAWRFGWRTPRLEAWINRRQIPKHIIDKPSGTGELWTTSNPSLTEIALPCEAICSVLADQAWSLAGKSVMQGVAHQCVTPGALAGRLLSYPDAQWIWPGAS